MRKLEAVALAAALFFATATPAFAGLEFAKSFSAGPGSSAGTSISISTSGGSYDPVGTASFSGTNTFFNTAVLDVSWSPGQADAASPGNRPDLILYFGSISEPVNGLELTSVGVSEDGSTFVTQNFGDQISSAFANSHYDISFNDSTVTPSQRDNIVAARFTFTYPSATTFVLDGVATPEPGAFALFGLGLLGLGGVWFRKRRRRMALR